MYDPYHLLKSHFSQKSFCYHVYKLPEAATGDFWKNFEDFTKKIPMLESLIDKVAGL